MPKFVRMLVAVLALIACSAHAAPAYHAVALGGEIAPKFVNDLGQVAGIGPDGKPVIWNRDGSLLHLAGAASEVTITGFNNQGTVVGNAVIPGFSLPQPVMWRNGGAVERLPLYGLAGFTAGINNRGDIIGYMAGASGTGTGEVGFIQWGDGTAPQLFDDYRPQAINDHAMVLGRRGGEWGTRSWQDGAFGETLFAGDLFIRALNNDGRMAGTRSDYHVFSMIEREGQADLHELWFGFGHDINDAGTVIGETDLALRAMLWIDGRTYALDHLWHDAQFSGWALDNAWDINNGGAILARGTGPFGESGNFLLSPVPEPQAVVLLLAGLVLLAAWQLAQRKLLARLSCSSLLALFACNAYAQVAPAYRAIKFDGQFTPQFLNDAGQVAGIGLDGKPVIWNPDGSLLHLPGVVSQLAITGFNNQGTIIGNATVSGFPQTQAVMWRNGGPMELIPFAASGIFAAGMNDRGDIVGYSTTSTGPGSGPTGIIQWGDGSAPQLFNDYRPRLINNQGLVIGGRTDEFGARSWRDGVFGEFRLPYDYNIEALNAEGRLAGFQDNGRAFTLLWRNGMWEHQDLWAPWAYDINDAGSVVGESGYRRAMLWYRDMPYVMDHLWNQEQYAGWFLKSAWDINASGQVLARGESEWQAGALFLLSPVPEPAQGALLLAGLALLGSLRLRTGRRSA